jgi:hypothetical protein
VERSELPIQPRQMLEVNRLVAALRPLVSHA